MSSIQTYDVVVIGAGAAGLMCAASAGYRGRRVLLIDHANKAGKKILMSGGGRCNFTHMETEPGHFRSANPHFCISALKRYTPRDFVDLVDRHGLEYHEKTPGQLFCNHKASDLLDILLTECEWAGVELRLNTPVTTVETLGEGMRVCTPKAEIHCGALVIATGGLSIPTLGATGFGYDIARQFGLALQPTRAGLVPFTLHPQLKEQLAPLSGISADVMVRCGGQMFAEPMLITHRGLSGPAMLQISSYWQPGDRLHVNLMPLLRDAEGIEGALRAFRRQYPRATLRRWLAERFPKRLAQLLADWWLDDAECKTAELSIAQQGNQQLAQFAAKLADWIVSPAGTEGYRTAEVTLGGVDTSNISSKDFSVQGLPQLRFIGEVLDVTGQLGGFNFQWAWASGWCCGESL